MDDALQAAVSSIEPYPSDRFGGRGIVICAGGPRFFTCAWVCIGILRRVLKCTLPIEVWYLGSDEMGAPMRGLLEELEAQPVDAMMVAKRHSVAVFGGWELKVFALRNSRFREILLLDADNVPVADPTFLFDSHEYQDSGTLFWPDVIRLTRQNPIWSVCGVAFRDQASIESGQVLIDKARCWRALALANWMNQRSEFFYQYLHGDKDTFLFAWLMLGAPYHLIGHLPRRLPSTLCQRAPDGSVLFQHRNEKKWLLVGVNPRIDGFRHEEECFALLDELRRKWDGRVFNPPGRPEAALDAERLLIAQRRFRLTRVSDSTQPVELLADHRIRAEPASCGFYWYIEVSGDELRLAFEGNGRQTCRLEPSDSGIWRGTQLVEPGLAIELEPVTSEQIANGVDHPSDRAIDALLERVLDAYTTACHDADVTRDFIGTIRTLALMDAQVAVRLVERLDARPEDGLGPLVRLALAGLNLDHLLDKVAIRPGVPPHKMTALRRYYDRES
jgi:hypothetical protein